MQIKNKGKDVTVSFTAKEYLAKKKKKKPTGDKFLNALQRDDYAIGSWDVYGRYLPKVRKLLRRGEVFLEGDLSKDGEWMVDGDDPKTPNDVYLYEFIRETLPFYRSVKLNSAFKHPYVGLSQDLDKNGLKCVYTSDRFIYEPRKTIAEVNRFLPKLRGKRYFFQLICGFYLKQLQLWVDER